MVEAIVNFYWKTRRYIWKKKLNILQAMVDLYNLAAPVRNVILSISSRSYWKTRSQLMRTFWVTYGFFSGCYWIFLRITGVIRVALIRFRWEVIGAAQFCFRFLSGQFRRHSVNSYWFFRRIFDRARAVATQLYHSSKVSSLFYPLKKIFWFTAFQFQTRVLVIFRKKPRN